MVEGTARRARLFAFYLPQYHPIPENEEWWEPGFTEWTNVTRARRLFRGHVQPHLPADLGFYDLRVPETRQAQASLARAHGIEAFCWYHYWFAGRRLLERPFDEVLASGEPDFPFLLVWANQTWTGVWHGEPGRILVEQTYPGDDDHRAHFASLEAAFHDPRYVRVDGRPVFYLYAPHEIPELERTLDLWRQLATASGLDGLYLVGERQYKTAPRAGFDAVVPVRFPWLEPVTFAGRMRRRLRRGGPARFRYEQVAVARDWSRADDGVHPSVLPNWDNTPRTGRRGLVLTGTSPEQYASVLEHAVTSVQDQSPDRRIVFVKSWNEWAEGNYLEPDQEFGRGWLEATDRVTRLNVST